MLTPLNTVNLETEGINSEIQVFNKIKQGTSKQQLKKAAQEFEGVFITKMLSLMDKTVDKEDSVFGKEGNFLKNFKSLMYTQMGRDMAKNPTTTFGFAAQIYKQMEKSIQG